MGAAAFNVLMKFEIKCVVLRIVMKIASLCKERNRSIGVEVNQHMARRMLKSPAWMMPVWWPSCGGALWAS